MTQKSDSPARDGKYSVNLVKRRVQSIGGRGRTSKYDDIYDAIGNLEIDSPQAAEVTMPSEDDAKSFLSAVRQQGYNGRFNDGNTVCRILASQDANDPNTVLVWRIHKYENARERREIIAEINAAA